MESSHDFQPGTSTSMSGGGSGLSDPFLHHSERNSGGGGASHAKAVRSCRIYYPVLFWTIFLALTLFAILDRFLWHIFEMSINFKPLTEQLAVKFAFFNAPMSVIFFDNFGRACGRVFLTTLNGLFFTQCKTSENFLMEHHPRWLDLGDLRTLNNRIHYILGVFFMAIPMVLHCVLIFLPSFNGVPFNLFPGGPPAGPPAGLVKLNPFVLFRPATRGVEMFITHDNIWRTLMAVALFAILFPFSMSNYGRRKWFGPTMLLHVLCASLFTLDQIRRAPHAQVFSTPAIAYFLVDRAVGLWLYRTGEAAIIHKELLDSDYMVVFLYVPAQKRRRMIGSTYYLQFTGIEGALDFAHPYVAFQNHTGEPLLPEWTNRDASSKAHKFYVDRSGGERKFNRRNSVGHINEEQLVEMEQKLDSVVSSETEDTVFFANWNTALIVQVHRWNTGDESFSTKLSRKDISSRVRFWGPYISEYGEMTPDGRRLPPIIQIASGTGCGPILDFYLHFTSNKLELLNPVTVYFSTNSIGLFQFFTDLTCARQINNYAVNAHLTSADDFTKDFEADTINPGAGGSERDMKLGRLSFMDVLGGARKDSEVYFCGAPALQWKVEVACATYGLAYHAGHKFTSEGGISCHRVGACSFVCQCTRFPCCLCL